MITHLFSSLKKNTTLLTPNQRLAATLLKKYHLFQMDQGKSCWPTLDVLPLTSWIKRLWSDYTARAMIAPFLVLTPNQELVLWEEIIAQTPEGEYFLKLSELATLAKSAWVTLKQWRTDFQHPAFSYTENSRAFQGWAKQFSQRCGEEKWIDQASLTAVVIEAIQQGNIFLPEQLIIYNFTELTPQHRILFRMAEEQGTSCHEDTDDPTLAMTKKDKKTLLLPLPTEEIEIQAMARWSKKIIDHQPTATISCIVPDIEKHRDTIITIFKQTFGKQDAFNISAGKPLATYPVIQAALQILSLSSDTVSIEALSQVLHSPFLGDAEKEMLQRIRFDTILRRYNITTLTWHTFLENAKHSLTQFCPQLAARIQNWLQQKDILPSSQGIRHWMTLFAQLLEILGWPGEQSLNSVEYQIVMRWLELLKETAGLERVLLPVSYKKALHYLRLLATKTYFQPQSPEASIQILGQLEGAGIPCDYLWVMGLSDTTWPKAPSPNPFIPQELQKNLHMPNATADRELEYSLQLTEQFKQSAPVVIFSYPQHNENEELHPSPLIANLPAIPLEQLALPPIVSMSKQVFAKSHLETLAEELTPPILPEEKIHGGTDIFKQQAACPFKAFAEFRLGAYTLETPQPGLRAKDRGSVVHKALELLWLDLQDQHTLLQCKDEPLRNKIQQHVRKAFTEILPFVNKATRYAILMRQRLEKLLWDWMQLEKSRPIFKVCAQEQEKTVEISNLSITIRIDRIDELSTGEKLIIDYKTKKECNAQDWLGKRLTEPQLPLYCITHPDHAIGIAFAQLHTTKKGWHGIAQGPLCIPGITAINEMDNRETSTWEKQLEQWRSDLTKLAQDFQQGIAYVDPKDPNETCRHCDLHTFCRVNEICTT